MPEAEPGTSAGQTTGSSQAEVTNQLSTLVPSFDPAVDSVEIFSNKVTLLLAAWPQGKILELATRLILNSKGTAFQKLQLHQSEILVNDPKGIRRLVEIVGGTWGQVPLEKKFELAEKALYRGGQKPDETSDSYLARSDVIWTELISKNVQLQELRAYVVLRGSKLPSEDKKRIIVESGAESGGVLDMKKVEAAVRMLGSGFFQELTFGKKDKSLKTYDHTAFNVEDDYDEDVDAAFWVNEDTLDEDMIDTLASENDEDAMTIVQFEEAVQETIQSDADLCAYYSSYQEARRRLSDRVKSRGFWPVKKGSFDKGRKGKGKGGKGKAALNLARRIAGSNCRLCGKRGHWKDECPMKQSNTSTGAASSIAPTSFVVAEDVPECISSLPLSEESWSPIQEVFCVWSNENKTPNETFPKDHSGKGNYVKSSFVERFRTLLRKRLSSESRKLSYAASQHEDARKPKDLSLGKNYVTESVSRDIINETLFASSGSIGVVDLGASQTVIGSNQVNELLANIPSQVKSQTRRVACNLTFRFGNQQTLASKHALLLPLGSSQFRIAIVPGNTPFLLSSSFLKGIQAVIDTDSCSMWSKKLNKYLPIEVNPKNLYLLDINHLWTSDTPESQVQVAGIASSACPNSLVDKSCSTAKQDRTACETRVNVNHDMSSVCNQESLEIGQQVQSKQFREDHEANHQQNRGPRKVTGDSDVSCTSTNVGEAETPSISSDRKGQQCGSRDGEDRPHDAGRVGEGTDSVWNCQDESSFSGSIQGSQVDGLVCGIIRDVNKASTPKVREVRREEVGSRNVGREKPEGVQGTYGTNPATEAEEQSNLQCGRGNLGHDCSSGLGRGSPGSPTTSTRRDELHPHGECPTTWSIGQHGDGDPRAGPAHQGPECENRGIGMQEDLSRLDPENDYVFHVPEEQKGLGYQAKIKRMVAQFARELKEVQVLEKSKRAGPRIDLLEVMCSSHSELTHQMRQVGGTAHRFGLEQGDLQTTNGRMKLFEWLVRFDPKHLWYSPVCRPWCLWSNINIHKSIETLEKIMQDRDQNLWQISLGIVLFRYQVQNGRHYHMEQPRGPQMLTTAGIQEIINHTYKCCFDLCTFGNLKDPQTRDPIRKSLIVCSTSADLFHSLHGRVCKETHQHKVIAGNTKWQGKSIALSKYTENYPRKFARQVAKVLLHQKGHVILAADDHPTKRRRLGEKMSPIAIEQQFPSMCVNWQTVMQKVDRLAPRVGTLILEDPDLISQVSQLCPQHEIKKLVACRGMNRYIGPGERLEKGIAPLRKMIRIRRIHEDIDIDSEWEPWERLSLRGLRRKCTPTRVGLTVFAACRPGVRDSNRPLIAPSADAPIPTEAFQRSEREHPNREEPRNKKARTEEFEESHDTKTENTKETIDLVSQQHGPKFQSLSSSDQQWLLKLHRNMGHPGSIKLGEFCKQLGCPSEIIQAIPDLRCSTCVETRAPSISRPSAIHPTGDFGDVLAMDGITWTNSQGSQFHFYHFVDQTTLYHTAVCAPSRTAENASMCLSQGWIGWAGSPGLLCIDAATELNSEQFQQFLQKHGIKSKTSAPEAHWQNSRIERHGGILQLMLKKMDIEESIDSYEKLTLALHQATMTKNRWSRVRGYSPEMLVFGKQPKIPGSVVSDDELSSHAMATSQMTEGQRFRHELAIREQAQRAFIQVDNDAALRRALVHRSRPHRGHYEKGSWVMMWKKKGEAEGNWVGPFQVIVQEDQKVVWVTQANKLYRVAPEHLRHLSAMEEWRARQKNEDITRERETSVIPPHGGTQFHDLIESGSLPRGPEMLNENQNIPQPNIAAEAMDQQANSQPSNASNSDQPDNEPETQTIPSSGESASHPEPHDASVPADEIPVPSDDELLDEASFLEALFVNESNEGFSLPENCKWEFEVEISQNDINQWKREDNPHQMAFLVSAAKRQRSEVKMSHLNSHDKELFQDAKEKEAQSWIDTETVARILRHQVPRENVLRSRWILTWKEVDDSNHKGPIKHKPKARLVVLGYEDPLVDSIPRDSPTMSKMSRMLILQYAASMKWNIESFDIKTAFLRGQEQSSRVLGMEPPDELRRKMKLNQNEIVQLLKGAYGRVDAPYLWYVELKRALEKLGFVASPFDPCTFVLVDEKTKETIGLVGVHVDDGLCCGNKEFQRKLQELEKVFPFGSRKNKEFTFTGLKIAQQPDFSIWVSQQQYVRDVMPITISSQRRQEPEEVITEDERQSLRAVIGSLQYAAINTRPDLCSRLGWLQSQINKAKVSTLLEANRTLHEAKTYSDVTIKIKHIPIEDLRFVAFSDASFASEKNPDSHQGMIIMACHSKIGDNQASPISPMIWHSKKIQKVAVSTLSAEAMALAGAVDSLSWIRLYWAWLTDIRCEWQKADRTLLKLPAAYTALPQVDPVEEEESNTEGIKDILKRLPKDKSSLLTTDCKSLYDLISRTAPPSCQEFRTQLQAKLIKEHLQNGIQIRWVPSQAQIADALTKRMENHVLRECIAIGRYNLLDEQEILKARSDKKARVKWLRESTHNK